MRRSQASRGRAGPQTLVAYRHLFGIQPFRRLAIGDLVSSIGDGMSAVAVAWQALELAPRGSEGASVAAAVAAYTLPGVVGGFALARPLGRVGAKTLISIDSWNRAVMLGTAAVLGLTGRLEVIGFVALLAVSSIVHPWGIAGRRSLVPALVPPADRLPANSVLLVQQHASFVIGPAIAGAVAGVLGPATAIALDACSFVILALLVRGIDAGSRPPSPAPRAGALRRLAAYRQIVVLLGLTWVFYMLYGPVEVALPLFVDRNLLGGATTLGLLWAAFGVGAAAGGAATPLLRRASLWRVVTAVVVGWGVAMVVLGLTERTWQAGATMLAAGVVFGPYAAITTTAIQRAARPEDLASLNAFWASAIVGAAPLGAALGGPLVQVLGAAGTLVVSGLATVGLGAVALALRARGAGDIRVDDDPSDASAGITPGEPPARPGG